MAPKGINKARMDLRFLAKNHEKSSKIGKNEGRKDMRKVLFLWLETTKIYQKLEEF